MLISKNGNVKAEDENKWTPLHFAAENGTRVVLAYWKVSVHFWKQSKIIWYSVLQLGHINIARMLLSHGAKVDAKTNNNQTAIMLAYQNGNCYNSIKCLDFKILSNFAL